MSQQKTWVCAICGETTRKAGHWVRGAQKKICRDCYNRVGAEMEAAGLITKSSWGGWNWEVLPPELQEKPEAQRERP